MHNYIVIVVTNNDGKFIYKYRHNICWSRDLVTVEKFHVTLEIVK